MDLADFSVYWDKELIDDVDKEVNEAFNNSNEILLNIGDDIGVLTDEFKNSEIKDLNESLTVVVSSAKYISNKLSDIISACNIARDIPDLCLSAYRKKREIELLENSNTNDDRIRINKLNLELENITNEINGLENEIENLCK